MIIKLIKKPDGLRIGNLILVDSIVYPPNFITARPAKVGEGFESFFNDETENCAYLTAEDRLVKQILKEEREGKFCKGAFEAEKISQSPGELPEWKIKYEGHEAVISFIHEMQNYYKDWTGKELI